MTDKQMAKFDKNWKVKCQNCGALPTVTVIPLVDGKPVYTEADALALCGPCCFGESDTAGGNW